MICFLQIPKQDVQIVPLRWMFVHKGEAPTISAHLQESIVITKVKSRTSHNRSFCHVLLLQIIARAAEHESLQEIKQC